MGALVTSIEGASGIYVANFQTASALAHFCPLHSALPLTERRGLLPDDALRHQLIQRHYSPSMRWYAHHANLAMTSSTATLGSHFHAIHSANAKSTQWVIAAKPPHRQCSAR